MTEENGFMTREEYRQHFANCDHCLDLWFEARKARSTDNPKTIERAFVKIKLHAADEVMK